MSIDQLHELVAAADLQAAARKSVLMFVRSQDHLALANEGATGRRLNANEVVQAYGFDALKEVLNRGSAIISSDVSEPARTLLDRRAALGLSIKDVAKQAGLTPALVSSAEDPARRNGIRDIERIAEVLGLDERLVSFESGARGDNRLAIRLKNLGGISRMTPGLVITLSEASWVITTYARLKSELGLTPKPISIEPRPVFSRSDYPVWRQGYDLAAETRRGLGLDEAAPISSMRELCADLTLPLLQTNMPRTCAGATVASNGVRGIVINTAGYNTNVWVRRATIAHELGHFFWDPNEQLNHLAVDDYGDIESLKNFSGGEYESRANAFAIALLAPPDAVRHRFDDRRPIESLRDVAEFFGISFSAAKHHIQNVTGKTVSVASSKLEPSADWIGRESFTDDFFPIPETPPIRRGDFARIGLLAYQKGLLSVDTFAAYLRSNSGAILEHESALASVLL